MITYCKDKNHKSRKKCGNYTILNTIIGSIDTIFIIGAKSNSITLSVTGIGLIILPISAGIVCTLSICNKVLHKIIINKYNKHKKLPERDQQAIKSFKKINRKSLEKNLFDKI